MVEVFKTDIHGREHANMILVHIHKNFDGYQANFDLEDCDKILRVKSLIGDVQSYEIIGLLRDLGCHAEVLPDDDQPSDELRAASTYDVYA